MSLNIDTTRDKIRATFKFLEWQELYSKEKPFQVLVPIPKDAEDQRTTNLVFKEEEVEVQDARTLSPTPTLDTHGFMLRKCPWPNTDFSSRQSVEQTYFPEVERLLKQEVDDVGQIFIFDWRLRNTLPESAPGTMLDFSDRTTYLRPAVHFHVDQSPAGVLNRVMLQLKQQSSTLLRHRVRVINLWRPLVDCVGDWPLALCDGSTAHPKDFIETDHLRRHYTGSSMYLERKPNQKFYYYSRQGKEDVLFLKIFDSKTEGIQAPFCPHASFKLPYTENDGVPRRSIEVRCLVFSTEEAKVPLGFHEQVKNKYTKDIDTAADAEMLEQLSKSNGTEQKRTSNNIELEKPSISSP